MPRIMSETRPRGTRAYHQGTVWPWLIGPFLTAYQKVHGKSTKTQSHIRAHLALLLTHLWEAGLGTVSEIFDGDMPHEPRGTIAQAWSVGEILRVLREELGHGPRPAACFCFFGNGQRPRFPLTMFQEFFPILEGAPMGGLWLLLIYGTLAVALWMFVLWLVQVKLENAGVVEFGWASSLAFLGVFYAIKADGYGPRRWLVGTMAFLWGGRLAWHLLSERVLGGKPEDPRYAALRERWPRWTGVRFLIHFEARALLAILLSAPFALLAVDPLSQITVYEWIGVVLWLVAFVGEWKTDSPYFGWLIWVAYFVAALETPYGAWTALCPLVMLISLRRRIARDRETFAS